MSGRELDEVLFAAAMNAGLLDRDMWPLARQFLDDVRVNSAGEFEGIEKAITAFKAEKPTLFSPPIDARTMSKPDYKRNLEMLLRQPVPARPSAAADFNARTASKEEYAARKRELLGR